MTTTIRARWQKPGRLKPIRLIVVHCTVSPEMGSGAEAVANYFRTVSRPASTHLVSDNNSTVRCVPDGNTACGAAGVNADGLHIELVGYPSQTREQWLDPYSRAELHEAGPHILAWSKAYGIPLRWLTVAQVRDGRTKGLCTHADASAAFPDVSTGHWDPGPAFPKDEALRIWNPAPPPPPLPEDDDVAVIIRGNDSTRSARMLAGPVAFRISKTDREGYEKQGVPSRVVDDNTYDAMRKQLEHLGLWV